MASGWGDRYRKQLLNQDDEGGEKISPGGEHPATDEEAVVVGDDERTERSCHEMGSNGKGGSVSWIGLALSLLTLLKASEWLAEGNSRVRRVLLERRHNIPCGQATNGENSLENETVDQG